MLRSSPRCLSFIPLLSQSFPLSPALSIPLFFASHKSFQRSLDLVSMYSISVFLFHSFAFATSTAWNQTHTFRRRRKSSQIETTNILFFRTISFYSRLLIICCLLHGIWISFRIIYDLVGIYSLSLSVCLTSSHSETFASLEFSL